MNTSSIDQSVQQLNLPETSTKFSISIPTILSNINKIAIPAILLVGLSYIQAAEAGPIAYAACMAACGTTGPFVAACWVGCVPLLTMPGP